MVDWGLAKVIGKADITTTRPGDDFEPSLASRRQAKTFPATPSKARRSAPRPT